MGIVLLFYYVRRGYIISMYNVCFIVCGMFKESPNSYLRFACGVPDLSEFKSS